MAHEFIEFRRHVEEMIKNGELKSRVDILLYAIKERQRREILFRLPNPLVSNDRYTDPVWPLFTQDYPLDKDDYQFLFDSLDADACRKIMINLITSGIEDDFYTDHSRHLLKQLFQKCLDTYQDNTTINNYDLGKNMIAMLLNTYGSAEKAFTPYRQLVTRFAKPDELGRVFYSNILSAVESLSGAKLASIDNDDKYQKLLNLEAIANSARSDALHLKICYYHTFINYGLLNWSIKSEIKNNTEIDSGKKDILRMRLEHLNERLDFYAQSINSILGMGVNSALEVFGNRNSKKGGSDIPSRINSLVQLLRKLDIDPGLTGEMGTKLVIKLLNGSVKNMNRDDMNQVIISAAPLVDWKTAVEGLNEQGLKLLIQSGADTELFRDYLKHSNDRVLVLNQDLGL